MKRARVNFQHIGWAIIQTRFSGVGEFVRPLGDYWLFKTKKGALLAGKNLFNNSMLDGDWRVC